MKYTVKTETQSIRDMARRLRAGCGNQADLACAREYLRTWARKVNGRNCLIPIGIPACTGKVRTHECYVCESKWTTAAKWPETVASIARRGEHLTRHAREHAGAIALYAHGRIQPHEIGAKESIERLARARAQAMIQDAEQRVRAARQEARDAIKRAENIVQSLRRRGYNIDIPCDALPETLGDRFAIIEME